VIPTKTIISGMQETLMKISFICLIVGALFRWASDFVALSVTDHRSLITNLYAQNAGGREAERGEKMWRGPEKIAIEPKSTVQISSSPTPTPPPPLATHPAVMAQEIALFRPWDGTVWLTIHRRGENDWRPSFVDILTDYKPIVKKVRSNTGGWEWQITFTTEIAED